jgi:peptidoglycan hydrolase CwlO-like protein
MQYNFPDLKPEIAQLESDIFDLESTINKLNALIGDRSNGERNI